MPTTRITAPKLDDVTGNEAGMLRKQLLQNTEAFNLCGYGWGPSMLQTFMLADPVLVPIIDPVKVPDDLTQLSCPRCSEFLSLHIPDPELSDRMLATCEACKS